MSTSPTAQRPLPVFLHVRIKTLDSAEAYPLLTKLPATAPRPSLEDRFKDQPELESQQQGLLNLLKGSSPAAPSTDRPALNVTNHATDGFESGTFQVSDSCF